MRSFRILAVLLFACGVVLLASASRAQDQASTGDPVADAARKAREEKKVKVTGKPKKVFTEDDVKPAEPPAPVATNASSQTSVTPDQEKAEKPQAAAPQDDSQKENPNSEKAWRQRFAEQHKKIADAELELDVLQREVQKAGVQYYSDPQKAMKEQFSRTEINEKNAKIEQKQRQIADLKQQLAAMEDQLRASGGDPGWAR